MRVALMVERTISPSLLFARAIETSVIIIVLYENLVFQLLLGRISVVSALIINKIATKGKYKNYYISLTQYHRWGKIIPYYKTMKNETETGRTFAVPITGSEYDWRGSRRVVKEKEKRCGSVGEGRVDKFKKWWGGLLFIQVQEFAIDGTLIRPT